MSKTLSPEATRPIIPIIPLKLSSELYPHLSNITSHLSSGTRVIVANKMVCYRYLRAKLGIEVKRQPQIKQLQEYIDKIGHAKSDSDLNKIQKNLLKSPLVISLSKKNIRRISKKGFTLRRNEIVHILQNEIVRLSHSKYDDAYKKIAYNWFINPIYYKPRSVTYYTYDMLKLTGTFLNRSVTQRNLMYHTSKYFTRIGTMEIHCKLLRKAVRKYKKSKLSSIEFESLPYLRGNGGISFTISDLTVLDEQKTEDEHGDPICKMIVTDVLITSTSNPVLGLTEVRRVVKETIMENFHYMVYNYEKIQQGRQDYRSLRQKFLFGHNKSSS